MFLYLFQGDGSDANLPRWGIVLGELLIMVPLIALIRKAGLPLASTLGLNSVHPVTIRNAVLIGVGVSVLVDELDRLIAMVFPLPESITGSLEFLTFATWDEALLVLLGASIIAPLVEETLFRGFCQGQLEKGYGDATKAVLIASLLFVVLHFNPWWALQIYVFGVVLGYLAWRTGSVWPAVIVHGINNSLSVVFANLEETDYQWYVMGDHVNPMWLLVSSILAYAGLKSLIDGYREPVSVIIQGE